MDRTRPVPTIVPATRRNRASRANMSQLCRSAKCLRLQDLFRKIEDGREAAFRLANHRLQPLGHLTAARNLSIRHALSYGEPFGPHDCPWNCPCQPSDRRENGVSHAPATLIGTQRFFSTEPSPEPPDMESVPRLSRCPLSVNLAVALAIRPLDFDVFWSMSTHRFCEPPPIPTFLEVIYFGDSDSWIEGHGRSP